MSPRRLPGAALCPLDLAIGGAVCLASILLLIALMDSRVLPYDEGLILYGAARVAGGDVPYRDFWTLYGPASFYVLGGLFRFFGESVLVGRSFDIVCRSAIIVLAYLLARRLVSGGIALAAALASLFILIAAQSYEAPIFPSLACALLAIWIVARAMSAERPQLLSASAGVAVGVAVAFRNDIGIYAFIAVAFAWIGARHSNGLESQGPSKTIVPFVLGCATVVLSMVALLIAAVPLSDLYQDLVRIPLEVYAPYRRLPFPIIEPVSTAIKLRSLSPLVQYIVYVPPIVGVVASVYAVRLRQGRTSMATRADFTLFEMLVVLELLLILKGAVRVSLLHMAPALVAAAIVSAVLSARFARSRKRTLLLVLVVALAAKITVEPVAFIGSIDRLRVFAAHALDDEAMAGCEPSSIARLRCFRVDADLHAVIDYIDRNTSSDEPIYVGSTRHDKLFVNNVELYFLSGRRSSTKWHDLHPGVQTTLPIQQAMIDEFRARPPALVVLNRFWDRVREPNASATSSGVTLLDDWLRSHYALAFVRGTYVVMKPRVPVS